ncbi:MAG: S8 family serine peptidase, partial [Rhodothermales bacterium]
MGIAPVFEMEGAGKQLPVPFAAYTVLTQDSSAFLSQQAAWAAQPGVGYVQPNHRYRLDALTGTSDDPLLDSLAHLPVIRAFDAWDITTGSADVRVGFVDTGVFMEHPDLAGQFWINPGEDVDANGRVDLADYNGIDDDGNGFVDDIRGYDFVDRVASVEQGDYLSRDADPSDDDQLGAGRGHGTLVAGVLAARRDNGEGISGVAPDSKLVPLRAFGADGIGEDDDVAAAIIYAAQMGVDVVNLSFGDVFFSPIMREAIQFAVDKGTVIVASAGNLGGDGPHYPSDYPEVISVAWLNEEGTGISGRGTFGIGIDVGAPGSFIFTTLFPRRNETGEIDPEKLYGRRSGSSMAAPMVSAAAALLRSLNSGLSPASIRSILLGTATDIRNPGWDHRTAAGLLNVATALTRALPSRVEITSPDHDSGWTGETLAITGTVVDPSFESFSLYYTPGDEDLGTDWELIAGPITQQQLDDTLAVWLPGALPDGIYTLRLAASLRTGRTIEDRRRIYLDRSAPQVDVQLFNNGLIGSNHGVTIDLATDDLTEVEMRVTLNGKTFRVESDRRARRHGLTWPEESGRGGRAEVQVTATNVAGLSEQITSDFLIPPRLINTALFEQRALSVPHGYLLNKATDFDQDGLLEITLNQFENGWIGDTLATFEWDGTDFRPAQKLVANVIPRDVGDTDSDGLQELLTQVAGATLLLEQEAANAYPSEQAFIDTTGLSNPFDPEAAFGARLTDLDGDGRGEILVHNTRQWRLLEFGEGTYREVAQLDNPTTTAHSEITENEFQQPLVLVDDFDGDGLTDLLVGDGDGDWIMYEVIGDNALDVKWTNETRRYNAGARFASGDFDGDGLAEFVTFTQNWTQPTSDGEREPDIGLYYFWDSPGDDSYVLVDSLPIQGSLSRHGSMLGSDFDNDGKDELVLVHAPDLYVLSFNQDMNWNLRFYQGPDDVQTPSGLRSVAMVADDFDGDGLPEVIVAGADEHLKRFAFQAFSTARPPPLWDQAIALDTAHVRLSWRAVGADSVTVYRGVPGGAIDPIATTAANMLVDETAQISRYLLRAWFQGSQTAFSEERIVRPHAPAIVQSVTFPDAETIELYFSEVLDPKIHLSQFVLASSGFPSSLILGPSHRSVILRFESLVSRTDTLRWTGIQDKEGTPVGQSSIAVTFPAVTPGLLYITEWQVLDAESLMIAFSEALDPSFATDVANYQLQPSGSIIASKWAPEQANEVMLTVTGRAIGATGLETSLVVLRMQS